MGVFSETKILIGSATQQLVEGSPDFVKQAVFNAVMMNRDIATEIMDATFNCFAVTDVAKMFNYGRDKFVNGLPEGSKGWAPPDNKVIQKVLEKEFPNYLTGGKTIRVFTASLGGPNKTNMGIEHMVENDSNFISWGVFGKNMDYRYQGKSTYFEKMSFHLNESYGGTLYPLAIYGTSFQIPGKPLWIRYKTYHEPISESADAIYYSVVFQVINPDGSIFKDRKYPNGDRYWSYYARSNRYPELNIDNEGTSTPTDTFYFPVVPMRISNVDLMEDDRKDTPLYKTSKKLLKYIDTNIDNIREGINANPSIADVDHAYIVFGVDANTKSKAGIRYLYEYFEDEYARSPTTEGAYMAWVNGAQWTHPPINVIDIHDGTYKVQIGFSFINISQHKGKIGKIGDVTKETYVHSTELLRSSPVGFGVMWYHNHRNTLTLRKQISATEYRQVVVHGLIHSNSIYEADINYYTVQGTDRPLVIPINAAIAHALKPRDANSLYYESLFVMFNAFEEIELKWYETNFFEFVVKIVPLVIGTIAGTFDNLAGIISGAAAGGVTSIAIVITEIVLKTVITTEVFKFAIEKLGIELAALVAAVVVAVGVVGDYLDLFEIPDMNQFISTILQGFGSGSTEYIQDVLEGIVKETEQLVSEQEKLSKELQEVNELLKQDTSYLDPIGMFTDIGVYPWESATDYVNRNLKVNYSQESLDVVYEFVDNSLTLPIELYR